MPTVLNATLNVNAAADQNRGGAISGGGTFLKNNTGATTFYGANTFTGSVTINAGTVYARANNAAPNRSSSYVSGITVNTGATLKTDSDSLFGWDGTQARPIICNGGTLTTAAAGGESNADTDPNSAGSVFKITDATVTPAADGHDVVVTFPSVAGRTYRVDSSPSLTSPSWTPVASNLPGTGAPIQVSDPGVTGAPRYHCAVALLP